MADESIWPQVDIATWSATKKSFHLYAQMLGKLRVALSPAEPNWLHTSLALCARGITTGAIPYGGAVLDATLDVFTSEIVVQRSNGESRRVALVPVRPVADVFAAFVSALAGLGIECTLSPIPQELPDVTPFDEDHRPAEYDAVAVRRWFAAATASANIFADWRSHFFGRSAIAVWWGAMDVALLLFNGKHVAPPTDRGYIMKYDLDAELMNVGLYYGDETTPAFFYGYIYPEPPGAASAPLAPPGASWSETLHEWVLPYAAVRAAADPAADLRAFLDAIYAQCFAAAGWDRAALSYAAPPRKGPAGAAPAAS